MHISPRLARHSDCIRHDPHGPLLLIGGYGTVGRELAAQLRQHHPALPLVLAGRRPQVAAALQAELGVEVQGVDLGAAVPLLLSARGVVTLVNDAGDRVLRACLDGGVPLVDITRWTSRVTRATALCAWANPRAPVVLASGWMGGVGPWMAGVLARGGGGARSIDIGIVYDLADRAGEDAIAYIDRMGIPFEIARDGEHFTVEPLSDPTWLIEAGRRHTLVRIDTPEQWTLPLTLAICTAQTRIGFSSELATWALRMLRALGFFRWTRGPRFAGLRRALLRSTGSGGRALVRVRAEGEHQAREVTIIDRRGQAHLTALGALRAVERALGLDGTAPPPGTDFPELWSGDAIGWLRARGVDVREEAA